MPFLDRPHGCLLTLAASSFVGAILLSLWVNRLSFPPPLPGALHSVAPPLTEFTSTTATSHPSSNPNPHPKLEVDLPVPFTPQAPHGDWRLPYQEACEETSVLMALRYALGKGPFPEGTARREILKLVRENERTLGDAVDESIEEVQALIANIAPEVVTRVVTDPTVQDLKQELSSGNVIVVPVFGPALKNPFFHSPPPRYHMLLLRGYTADGFFIANEPGTEQGNGYLYPFGRLMEAMRDLNGGEAERGRKVVLVVEPL